MTTLADSDCNRARGGVHGQPLDSLRLPPFASMSSTGRPDCSGRFHQSKWGSFRIAALPDHFSPRHFTTAKSRPEMASQIIVLQWTLASAALDLPKDLVNCNIDVRFGPASGHRVWRRKSDSYQIQHGKFWRDAPTDRHSTRSNSTRHI